MTLKRPILKSKTIFNTYFILISFSVDKPVSIFVLNVRKFILKIKYKNFTFNITFCITGLIKEATGSYAYGVRLCGGMYLLGGIVYGCQKEMWTMLKDLLWPKNICIRLRDHCRK